MMLLQVWASKWNDRAWLSRKARGVADTDLFMACLLQQVRQHLLLCTAAAASWGWGTAAPNLHSLYMRGPDDVISTAPASTAAASWGWVLEHPTCMAAAAAVAAT